MKKMYIRLGALLFCSTLMSTPILANSTSRSNFGTTYGSTYINYVGGGGYKQAQVQTTTGYQVDLIEVSADYYIVNGVRVGTPHDSNKWSTKAYAQLTYDGGKVMGCNTSHYAKKGTQEVRFTTSDIT